MQSTKIQYLITPGVAKQQYDVRLYLFFTTELDPVQSAFFGCLYEAVRLHLPKVCWRALRLTCCYKSASAIPDIYTMPAADTR